MSPTLSWVLDSNHPPFILSLFLFLFLLLLLFPFSFSFFLFYHIYYFFCFIMKINRFIFSVYIYIYNRYTFGIVIQNVFHLKIFLHIFYYIFTSTYQNYIKTTKKIINLICFLSQTRFLNAFKHDFNYKNKLPICFAFDYCLLLKIRSNISNRNV